MLTATRLSGRLKRKEQTVMMTKRHTRFLDLDYLLLPCPSSQSKFVSETIAVLFPSLHCLCRNRIQSLQVVGVIQMVSPSSRTRGQEQGQRNIQLNATSKIWLGRSVPHHPPKSINRNVHLTQLLKQLLAKPAIAQPSSCSASYLTTDSISAIINGSRTDGITQLEVGHRTEHFNILWPLFS